MESQDLLNCAHSVSAPYICCFEGEVLYTTDFSFACQSSNIKAIGYQILSLLSVARINSSIANGYFMFKLIFSAFFTDYFRPRTMTLWACSARIVYFTQSLQRGVIINVALEWI